VAGTLPKPRQAGRPSPKEVQPEVQSSIQRWKLPEVQGYKLQSQAVQGRQSPSRHDGWRGRPPCAEDACQVHNVRNRVSAGLAIDIASVAGGREILHGARHSTLSPLTSYGADGRRGVGVSHPAAASPSGLLPTRSGLPGMGLTLRSRRSRRRDRVSSVVLAGRATRVPYAAVTSGIQRTPRSLRGAWCPTTRL
jgi:hypothetical protein